MLSNPTNKTIHALVGYQLPLRLQSRPSTCRNRMHLRYPELPVLGIIAAILVLIPVPRQIRARNVATIAIIFWFFEHCLLGSINVIVWAGNVNDSAPFLCDLSEAFCDLFIHRALTEISDQRNILMMECSLHSPLRRSVSAKISISSLLDVRLPLTSASGVEYTSRCLCALYCLAYGCFCVRQTASPFVPTLLTLVAQFTASNPHATLSSRILDASPRFGHHTSQRLSFSFRRWHWQ
jgi:Pheromone A receptor